MAREGKNGTRSGHLLARSLASVGSALSPRPFERPFPPLLFVRPSAVVDRNADAGAQQLVRKERRERQVGKRGRRQGGRREEGKAALGVDATGDGGRFASRRARRAVVQKGATGARKDARTQVSSKGHCGRMPERGCERCRSRGRKEEARAGEKEREGAKQRKGRRDEDPPRPGASEEVDFGGALGSRGSGIDERRGQEGKKHRIDGQEGEMRGEMERAGSKAGEERRAKESAGQGRRKRRRRGRGGERRTEREDTPRARRASNGAGERPAGSWPGVGQGSRAGVHRGCRRRGAKTWDAPSRLGTRGGRREPKGPRTEPFRPAGRRAAGKRAGARRRRTCWRAASRGAHQAPAPRAAPTRRRIGRAFWAVGLDGRGWTR